MTLTPEEEQLARRLDFDEDVLRIVKAGVRKPLEPFAEYPGFPPLVWSSADVLEGKELSVKLAERYTGTWEPSYLDIIHRLRSLLRPLGYMAFLTEAYNPYPCLAIIKMLDQNEVLRVTGTQGWDFLYLW